MKHVGTLCPWWTNTEMYRAAIADKYSKITGYFDWPKTSLECWNLLDSKLDLSFEKLFIRIEFQPKGFGQQYYLLTWHMKMHKQMWSLNSPGLIYILSRNYFVALKYNTDTMKKSRELVSTQLGCLVFLDDCPMGQQDHVSIESMWQYWT